MMRIKPRFFLTIGLLLLSSFVLATGGSKTMHMKVNLSDKSGLQSGAKIFRNYCLSCHSASYMRYNRMAKDLDISESVLKKNFIFDPSTKSGDTMTVAMQKSDAVNYFGVSPPDLSVIARSRGSDWLYSYLKEFYIDPSRPFGVNNLTFKNTSMPHVLWELQGLQKPVYKTVITEAGTEKQVIEGFVTVTPGLQTAEEYDRSVRELVNFLVYLGEPVKLKRIKIGGWTLVYLFIFLAVAYVLKKEYWRDVN